MNEPSPSNWEKLVAEPRRFFLWLAAFSLAVLVILFVATVLGPGVNLPPFLRSVGAFVVVGSIVAFLIGFFGFFLALIPPLRPLFRWVVRRSVFLLACLITLVALYYAQENWRGHRAWENFKREAVAKNEPVEIQAIIPPPVPDEQNVAAAPLFKELGNEFDPEWRRQHTGPSGITNTADRLKFSHTRANEQPPEDAAASWQRGRRTDLKAWQNYYRNPAPPEVVASGAQTAFLERYGLAAGSASNSVAPASTVAMTNEFPTTPQPQSPAADVLLALSKYDALVEELRVACERPHSRFPIRYEDGFSALLPHLARLKGINQFLTLRAAAELEAGQIDKAATDVRLALRVADLVREEPLLISQLVRLAQVQLALNPLWEGLVEHRWTDAQLIAFEQQLSRMDLLADYRHGMRGERAFCSWTIDHMRRHRDMIDNLGIPEDVPYSQSGLFDRVVGPALFHLVPGGWFDQNKASVGRMHLDLILPAVNPEARQVSPAKVEEMASTLDQSLRQRSPYNFFAGLLLPALTKASARAAQGQVAVDLARVACALERHRLALGQYPDALAPLAPRFIVKLPHDLINGKPLKYRRTDDGTFLLYSIGWNEKDDGGTTVLNKDQRSVDWKEGDWVWQMPAK